MYNKDTVLSIFNKKGTLLKWLKHLENTLQNSSLTSVEVNKATGASITLTFKFADNTQIVTPPFELPTVDAVPSFDEVDLIDLNYNTTVLSSANGFEINGLTSFTVNGEVIEIPSRLHFGLIGSDSVIVDVSEDNKNIEIHIDAEIINKLSRALLAPISNPASTVIAGINSAGAQVFLELGDGITVENGRLNIVVSGGVKLYSHTVTISGTRYGTANTADIVLQCLASTSTRFTDVITFAEYFSERTAQVIHGSYQEGPEFDIAQAPVRVYSEPTEGQFAVFYVNAIQNGAPTITSYRIDFGTTINDVVEEV